VEYVIEAHFARTPRWGPDDTMAKHVEVVTRRLERGQTFHQPYLGCREFAACVVPVVEAPPSRLPPEWRNRHLGLMLHDLEFGERTVPRFFAATIDGAGRIEVPPFEEAVRVEGLAKEVGE
jgi:CRISPR-associated protein Cas5d